MRLGASNGLAIFISVWAGGFAIGPWGSRMFEKDPVPAWLIENGLIGLGVYALIVGNQNAINCFIGALIVAAMRVIERDRRKNG